MKMIKTMNMSDIIITNSFAITTPCRKKMEACREYYNQHNRLDKNIIVNSHNVLIDGYIRYLVLRENNIKETSVEVKYKQAPITYVFGKHPGIDKEYVWRMKVSSTPDDIPVVGQQVLVQTKHGLSTVEVTRVEILSKPPHKGKIKKVQKVLNTEEE
jgi:hypothetical protein